MRAAVGARKSEFKQLGPYKERGEQMVYIAGEVRSFHLAFGKLVGGGMTSGIR